MESTYLYSVHPKKIIKGLLEKPIRTARSLYLTKEQVKVCLKYGSVYRRFANENKIERVLISNIDRLHNEKFMTESEYEQYKKSLTDSMRGSVINTDSETTPVLEEKPDTVEPEIKEEAPKNNNYGGKNNKHRR